MLARIAFIFIGFCVGFGAIAQPVERRLLEISGRLEAVNPANIEGGGLDLKELSKLAFELEDILSEMRQLSRDFDAERNQLQEKLFEQSQELTQLMGVIITLEAAPAPDYLLHPQGALASVHANQLLESVLPALEARVQVIGMELQKWVQMADKETQLQQSAELAFIQINALRQDIVVQERQSDSKRQVEEPMVLDALFAVSDNLNDFVNGLEQIDMDGVPTAYDFTENAGTILFPVAGEPVPYRQGVQILTQDNLVKTPFPATVRFAADFLDYGNLVIIEPQNDVLVVVAGLQDLAVAEGDVLDKNEIIGFFALSVPENEQIDEKALERQSNKLYVETRIDGNPVNTLDYFQAWKK